MSLLIAEAMILILENQYIMKIPLLNDSGYNPDNVLV